MPSFTMRFPPEITFIFKFIVLLCLANNIIYYFVDFNHPTMGYYIASKVVISFTAIISYLNDRNKMLVLFNRGIIIDDIEPSEKEAKLSFVFIIIAIIYNPIAGLFHSKEIWLFINSLTLIFFFYKSKRASQK